MGPRAWEAGHRLFLRNQRLCRGKNNKLLSFLMVSFNACRQSNHPAERFLFSTQLLKTKRSPWRVQGCVWAWDMTGPITFSAAHQGIPLSCPRASDSHNISNTSPPPCIATRQRRVTRTNTAARFFYKPKLHHSEVAIWQTVLRLQRGDAT